MSRRKQGAAETGLVRKRISAIRPSPENDQLYRPITAEDPDIQALAASIGEHGLLDPSSLLLTIGSSRATADTRLQRLPDSQPFPAGLSRSTGVPTSKYFWRSYGSITASARRRSLKSSAKNSSQRTAPTPIFVFANSGESMPLWTSLPCNSEVAEPAQQSRQRSSQCSTPSIECLKSDGDFYR